MLPVEAKSELLVGLAVPQQVGRAVDVDGLGELRLLLAGRVADDRRQVDRSPRRRPSAELDGGRGRVTSPRMQLEEAIRAAGQEPMAAELERVEHADPVSLLQQHRDERRADVTGSAGDENSHRRLHPWWLESRLERREVVKGFLPQGETGKSSTPGPRPCGLLPLWCAGRRAITSHCRPSLPAQSGVVRSRRHYPRGRAGCQHRFLGSRGLEQARKREIRKGPNRVRHSSGR